MPELPDLVVYVDALRERVVDQPLEAARVLSPFLLRTFEPALDEIVGLRVREVRRVGKRVAFGMEGELYLVFHLMIAGRFRWLKPGARPPGKIALAWFAFPTGTLALTEAAKNKRASLHVVQGDAALRRFHAGGLEVFDADEAEFMAALRRENRTLKRALTDPRLFSGIGNAYSDEILHAAKLSPVELTSRLSEEGAVRLYAATRATLATWIVRLREQFAGRFPGPGEITAFRPDFAVHGRFGQPCPECGTKVQRIRYAENETNYCPRCQTGGRVLADRSLSRLLRDDWPKRVEELEGT